ncbi:glycosyltransferase family 4 protein [Flavitalea flava]
MKKDQVIKIFADAHVFDSEFQGTRTFIKEIYAELARKPGIRLYLGACDMDNLRKEFPLTDNLVFVKYRSGSAIFRLLYDIPSIVRKYKIDFAHFQYISSPIKNCKQIVTIHDVLFNDFPQEFSLTYRLTKDLLFGISAARADIVSTVSGYSKEAINKWLRVKSENIHVIPNGVSPKFFEPYDRQQARDFISGKYGIGKFILYVSRIEPRKNHVALLKSYLELKLYEKGYYLVLLGKVSIPAPDFDNMMNRLPENIKSFIFQNSQTDDRDLLEFYRAAKVFVYPSKAEGFGIPPLEAAALQIPVICSNTSAMTDFSFFGENHINPLDNELLKTRLAGIIENPPGEANLKSIAEIIRQKYSWTLSAEKLYQAVLKAPY